MWPAACGRLGPLRCAAIFFLVCLTPFSTDLRGWLLSLTGAPRPRAHSNQWSELPPLFERAFYINADASTERREFMEQQLRASGVPFDRWPAVQGSPAILQSHRRYFARGVERHLLENHSFTGPIIGWGTVATYLSHHTLFEHIVQRWEHNESAAFLILQDDTQLNPGWVGRLHELMHDLESQWERVLLVWWGLKRSRDCTAHFCSVRPPAGPTDSGPECCGKRFYHGLQVRKAASPASPPAHPSAAALIHERHASSRPTAQAWIVRQRNLRCLLHRLESRKIKNIDALLVQCNCPHSYALRPEHMIGTHLDRELGSERAAVNAVWRSRLLNRTLKRAARRNMRKVQLGDGPTPHRGARRRAPQGEG